MDYSPLTEALAEYAFYYIFALLLLALIKSAWFKGWFGEMIVNFISQLFLSKNEYRLLKNITLSTDDGTTQIDHIIVSPYGVFVVETKNMMGWIFGSVNQKKWTQQIYRSKYRFQNPLHQNYKHVKVLQNLLNLKEEQIFSLVVFVGGSTFKTPMPDNVVYIGGYLSFIKNRKQVVLSSIEVEEVYRQISDGRLTPSLKTHREHVRNVNRTVTAKNDSELIKTSIAKNDKNICGRCGSEMVIRTAKSGANAGSKFWGCTSYPKCRNTKKVS